MHYMASTGTHTPWLRRHHVTFNNRAKSVLWVCLGYREEIIIVAGQPYYQWDQLFSLSQEAQSCLSLKPICWGFPNNINTHSNGPLKIRVLLLCHTSDPSEFSNIGQTPPDEKKTSQDGHDNIHEGGV